MGNFKLVKIATVTAIAASGAVAAMPADAKSNAVDKSISTAISKMSTAYSTYRTPSLKGKLPSNEKMKKAVKDAQSAYKKAEAQIKKNGGSKKKKAAYTKKLNSKKYMLTRAERYTDAININVSGAKKNLAAAVKKGKQADVLKKQTALNKKITSFEKAVAKVFGPDARKALLAKYAAPAWKEHDAIKNEMAVYKAYKKIESEKLIETDLAKAKRTMDSVEKNVKAISSKKGTLVKNILAAVKKNKAAYEAAVKAGTGTLDLTILHTNDTHAHLENAAKRATVIKEERSANPDALLVDAGDVFSGTLYFNEFKGQADVEFMNMMKYDMMTLGNHEFDLGSSPEGHKALAEFIKAAKFPIVSSNVDFSKDKNLKKLYSDTLTAKPKGGKMYSEVIMKVNGQNVGFFGLTTEETKDISSPGSVAFKDYIDEAKASVAALEKAGVNKIVAVTHIGYDDNPEYDNDQILAKAVKGIDVIVGGHSHTQLDAPEVVTKNVYGKTKEPTLIVQGYQYGDFVGKLDVSFDKDGKITEHEGKLIKTADKEADPEAEKMLGKYSDKVKEVMNDPTGATAVKALENPRGEVSVRNSETPLGNLITDGMLDKAKEFAPETKIAFQNGGGIRAAIDEGEITVGEVLTTLPFGNTLATMKLTGAEIIQALEHSVSQAPKELGGFLHVSGMKYSYDSTKPAGSRVVKAEVKGEDGSYTELDRAAQYTVATNAFTAKGGDGFDVFKKAYESGRVTDIGLADWENLRDYVAKLKTVDPEIEGRIVDVSRIAEPVTVSAAEFSGTADKPAVYNGDVIVELDEESALKYAHVKGDLYLKGASSLLDIEDVTVDGETILAD